MSTAVVSTAVRHDITITISCQEVEEMSYLFEDTTAKTVS